MERWKRNTAIFLSCQTVSLFGSALVQYAITWYITLNTQSGVMMTIAIICGFLPTFFISPFGGVLADRYNRKILIILADSIIAVATLALAIMFLTGYGSVWLLFAVSIIRALGAGIQTPTIGAYLPQLVPSDMLTKVNATNTSIQSAVTLISPMISGVLLTVASIEVIFFIDVVTAALAVTIMLLFLHVPAHAKALEQQSTSYLGDMREGLKYVINHRFIRTIFLFNAVYFVLVAPLAFLTPLQVTRSFGNDVWRLTAIEVAFSGGMMLGGGIIAFWSGFRNKLHTMVFSNVVIAICTFALGITPLFWVYLTLMALVGIALPIFNTPFTVLLQQKVEGNLLGRVFGVLSMISSLVMPLAMIGYGPIADLIKIEWLLIGTGALMLVQSLIMLRNKDLIEAGRPVAEH